MSRRLSSTYLNHSSSMPTSQERIVEQVLSQACSSRFAHFTHVAESDTVPLACFTAFTFIPPALAIRRPQPRGRSRVVPTHSHSSFPALCSLICRVLSASAPQNTPLGSTCSSSSRVTVAQSRATLVTCRPTATEKLA